MTTVTRKQIAQAFRAAKRNLWGGYGDYDFTTSDQFICCALDSYAWHFSTAKAAKDVVRMRLEGCYTLDEWLENQGVPEDQLNHERMQAHRHAWLDQLIAEFEAPAAQAKE